MFTNVRLSQQAAHTVTVRGLTTISLVVAVMACGADRVVGLDANSQTRDATVGQELEITLGNVGPGEYASPPQISSTAVTFLSVDAIPPYTPAGPTQRFRFKAMLPGTAVVTFRRTLNESTLSVVEDTIRVR